MSGVTLELVKELRTRSGAGMMDCKNALAESQGDMEKAIDVLRSKGLAGAAKRAGRAASEGVVALCCDGNQGVLLELNCETDFVARNKDFQAIASRLAQYALQNNISDMAAAPDPDNSGKTFGDTVQAAAATLGENLVLRRTQILQGTGAGFVAGYVHNELPDTEGPVALGKIGVLVHIATPAAPETLAELGRHIAMHVAANAPLAVSPTDIAPDMLARERAVYQAEADNSGKPANVIDKIIDGRIKKFLAQSTLLTQPFVMDGETPVQAILDAKAKELNTEIGISAFLRFMLGEADSGA